MSFLSKLRSLPTSLHRRRHFCVLSGDSTTPLSSYGSSRFALSLLRTETNPQRVLDICRDASLTAQHRLDRLAYSEAIYTLKESNSHNHIRTLLQESIARPDNQNELNVSYFIELYGQAGLLEDAIRTFEELEKFGVEKNVESLNSLLFACLLAKEYGELKRIYDNFFDKYEIRPNLETYNTLMKGFYESREANSFYWVVDEMERKGVKPNWETFGVMISGFYQEERLEDVGKVFQMMHVRRVRSGIKIYNVKIGSLCELGRMKEARAMLYGIWSDGSKVKPNWVTYMNLVHGYYKRGDLEEAMWVFEEMKEKVLFPLSECYCRLVHYLCEGKDFKAALDYSKECMEKNGDPEFLIMKSLVDGLVSISEVDEARRIIRRLKEKYSTNADKWSEIEEGLPK